MATGVCQQVQCGDLAVKILALTYFPPGKPASYRIRVVLGHDHALAVGDLVLFQARVKTVVGGLTGADPA